MGGDGEPPSEDPPRRIERPEKLPFNPEPARERLRGWIAAALTALFITVILLAFLLFAFSARPIGELKDFLIVVIPPVGGLVSALVGFYYGSTRSRD